MAAAFVTMPVAAGQEVPFGAFSAVAVADGARTSYSVYRFAVVEDFVDVGGLTAQATMDASGSRAFAALPDPGSTVIAYNTVVGLALGQGVPVDYPFFAESVHPGGASQEVSDPAGTYVVSTEAGSDAAAANAEGGSAPGDVVVTGSRATSTVRIEGNVLTARATAITEAVSFEGGEVVARGIRSTSETVLEPGGEPKTTTSLSVGSLEVNGMKFGYDDEGLRMVGTAVPLPRGDAQEALDAALEPLGVTATFIGPAEIAGGARSAVLELGHSQSVPSTSAEAVTTVQLGGATTFAGGDAGAVASGPLGADPTGTTAPAPKGPIATDQGSQAPVASSLSPAGSGAMTAATDPEAATGVERDLGSGVAGRAVALAGVVPGSIESLYLPLLVAGGLASMLAAGWMRRMMVGRWSQ